MSRRCRNRLCPTWLIMDWHNYHFSHNFYNFTKSRCMEPEYAMINRRLRGFSESLCIAWKGFSRLFLQLLYSWSKRYKMFPFSTKNAEKFNYSLKRSLSTTNYLQRKRIKLKNFTMLKFMRLIKRRNLFVVRQQFKSFFNSHLFCIRKFSFTHQ